MKPLVYYLEVFLQYFNEEDLTWPQGPIFFSTASWPLESTLSIESLLYYHVDYTLIKKTFLVKLFYFHYDFFIVIVWIFFHLVLNIVPRLNFDRHKKQIKYAGETVRSCSNQEGVLPFCHGLIKIKNSVIFLIQYICCISYPVGGQGPNDHGSSDRDSKSDRIGDSHTSSFN